jgi:hypothetical protein
MKIKIEKFNGSSKFLDDIDNAASKLPYFTKPSKQKTKIGSLVFDPVKTNNFLKQFFVENGWKPNVKIPPSFSHMGIHVDFLKDGVVMEVQFSNYPFLLNNIIRTEIFKKSLLKLDDSIVNELIIVTKAKNIPSANSSLYFEQAKNQIDSIIKYNMIDLPITLIGLYEN